jgi:hypothetical protein
MIRALSRLQQPAASGLREGQGEKEGREDPDAGAERGPREVAPTRAARYRAIGARAKVRSALACMP